MKKAVTTEENMVYNEPRDWLLNPKHYLGNAFLKAGQWQEARRIFESDLKNNDENGWALFGLYQAFTTGNRKGEGEKNICTIQKSFCQLGYRIAWTCILGRTAGTDHNHCNTHE